MARYQIAVIPGDGIGKEVVPGGQRVLEAAGRKYGVQFELTQRDRASTQCYPAGRG